MKRKDFLKLAGASILLSACKKKEMPNPNINRKALVSGVSAVYNANAETYWSRAGITNLTERNAIATLFNTLQSGTGVMWDAVKNGALYLVSPTSYGASLYNSVNTSFDLIAGVAPTYSTLGHSYNGSTQYLNTQLTPSVTCSRNSFLMGWTDTLTTGNRTVVLGSHQSSTNRILLQPCYDGANFFGIYLDSASLNLSGLNSNREGRYLFTVNNTANRLWLRNEATLISDTNIFLGNLPNQPIYIGGYNNAGTPAFTQCTITSAYVGTTALSSTNSVSFSTALKTYNDTVIPGGR